LFVFHAGHEWGGFKEDDVKVSNSGNEPGLVIPKLLKEGYSVLAFSMPIYSPEPFPQVSVFWTTNRLTLTSHADLFSYLEGPLRFFLEPIVVSLNYVQDRYSYRNLYMTGLSGGGWTTTVYPALDPRIERSYPVA